MSAQQILLVEGEADRGLYEALCQSWAITAEVKVSTPRDAGHRHNTKQAILQVLPQYLLQLNDGQIQRLGVVMDADSATHGGGFARTLAALAPVLAPHGYQPAPVSPPPGQPAPGLLFAHNDGLHPVGAWFMPNNADEGMVEDWIKACLHPNEHELMAHAQTAINQIPGGPKFKALHRTKAEVATWLAWQAKPEHGLYHAAQPGLLNEQAPDLVAFRSWLERVFPG